MFFHENSDPIGFLKLLSHGSTWVNPIRSDFDRFKAVQSFETNGPIQAAFTLGSQSDWFDRSAWSRFHNIAFTFEMRDIYSTLII